MRLDDVRESENVEDRRGSGGGAGFGGFGGGRLVMPGGLGIGGVIVLLLLSWLFGVNPLSLLSPDDSGTGAPVSTGPTGAPAANDTTAVFASKILADTEDTWTQILGRQGVTYQKPILVLFSNSTESPCGLGSAASGPFYCPDDRRVYLDLSFFHELADRFGAPGDFAQAYVIAHEVGHHVQNLLGLLSSAAGLSRTGANAISVKQELQADCLAGVWGHSAAGRGLLDPGDAQAGMAAASAVGDDHLQKMAGGHVSPESFTHGSSADRMASLKRGLDGGELASCGISR
jgi:predicted metalloprotease